MEQAHETLEKEMDVIEVIRFRRFVTLALKKTLTPELYQELKAHSQQMPAEQ